MVRNPPFQGLDSFPEKNDLLRQEAYWNNDIAPTDEECAGIAFDKKNGPSHIYLYRDIICRDGSSFVLLGDKHSSAKWLLDGARAE